MSPRVHLKSAAAIAPSCQRRAIYFRQMANEALLRKSQADMVLELGEPQWAKNLCQRALEMDAQYGYAHYQLACANVALNDFDEAVAGLARAMQYSDAVIDDIRSDQALAPLREYPSFKMLFDTPVASVSRNPEAG